MENPLHSADDLYAGMNNVTRLRRSASRSRLATAHVKTCARHACELETRRRHRDPARHAGRGSEEKVPERLEDPQALSAHGSAAEISEEHPSSAEEGWREAP